MFCENCGSKQDNDARFCEQCGYALEPSTTPAQVLQQTGAPSQQTGAPPQHTGAPSRQAPAPPPQTRVPSRQAPAHVQPEYNSQLIGFSQKINDPIFEERRKKNFRKSVRNGLIWLPVVVLLFQIVPFFSLDFTRPIALGVGCIVGGFGLAATLLGGARRAGAKTWDGEVIDKKVIVRDSEDRNGNAQTSYDHTIVFRLSSGGKKKMKRRLRSGSLGAWDMMVYLSVGDKVRYHGKLDYYEKYDKTRDAEVPCANCRVYVDLRHDVCPNCGAPVIKP